MGELKAWAIAGDTANKGLNLAIFKEKNTKIAPRGPKVMKGPTVASKFVLSAIGIS